MKGVPGALRKVSLMNSRRTVLQGMIAAAIVGGLKCMPALADVSNSAASLTVEGPIREGSHGRPFGAYFGDLSKLDYVEEEFFLSATATGFSPDGELGTDGKWSVHPVNPRPYKTRILVRRPRKAKAFNGTVVLEWANVSNGYEVSFADPAGLYDGFAYAAVSAQQVGVHGFPSNPKGLVQWDPERYGSLFIPGDSLSYDIFTHAARVLRPGTSHNGPSPLGDLKARKLIAVGGSQSGGRVLTYINAIQPLENVFDALMPIVCAGVFAPLDDVPAHPDPGAAKASQSRHSRAISTKVRDDLKTPVFAINSQTEGLYYYSMRQPDTDRFRYWEVAGASHGGTAMIASIRQKTERDGVGGPGDPSVHISDVLWLPTADSAIQHIHRWINGGEAPPVQQRMSISGTPPAYELDPYGNVIGGVRLPELEVPVARYVGMSETGSILGQTFPFPVEELRHLYPTHTIYVEKMKKAAIAAHKAGVIPSYRVEQYIEMAKTANVPS